MFKKTFWVKAPINANMNSANANFCIYKNSQEMLTLENSLVEIFHLKM